MVSVPRSGRNSFWADLTSFYPGPGVTGNWGVFARAESYNSEISLAFRGANVSKNYSVSGLLSPAQMHLFPNLHVHWRALRRCMHALITGLLSSRFGRKLGSLAKPPALPSSLA